MPEPFRQWVEGSGMRIRELVPDKSTLSRCRLPFVGAYALSWQDHWREHMRAASIYLQVDSSPQFGRDWLITVFTHIHND
eukprot:4443977-Alexandrium_andersonii.AAC.1